MLRPFILALCLGLMPLAAADAQTADGAGQGADLSENAYRRDVATGARLAVEDAELTMKYNAGKISAAHYDAAEAKVRQQSAALLDKWAHGVNRRASVMFSGDVWVKSRDEIIALRSRYPTAAPPAPQAAPKRAFDPYVASTTPEQANAANAAFVRKLLVTWLLPFTIGVIVLALVLGKIWGHFFPRRPEEEDKGPEVSDNYGSATYAGFLSDIPNRAYLQRGVFFGKSSLPVADPMPVLEQPGAPLCSIPEHHTLIVARTRTGKGTRIIVPTLLNYRGSALVIDPKGENAAITARARQSHLGADSPVHIINPWGELGSTFASLGFPPATFNPLDALDRHDPAVVAMAQDLAATISPTTGGSDEFWRGSAAGMLAAILLWITDQPGETKTLARAREIVAMSRKDFTEQFMVKMAASSAFGGAIRELISPYLDMADNTYTGIVAGLNESTRFLSDPQVKTATATSSFDFIDLWRLPMTVYLVIPPQRIATQRTWLRLVITAMTGMFRRVHDVQGQKPPHRCMFLIDEFPALGRMPDIPTDIATMAGYGVDYTLVVQGLDQLKEIYKEAASTIMSNCAFQWFCNIGDLESAKYLSEVLGKATVQTVGRSENYGQNPGGASEGQGVNYGETGRALLTPDEVLTLGRDKAIVLHPYTKPHYVLPIDYWNLERAFSRFQRDRPEMFWSPPLHYDPNPYHQPKQGGA